LRLKEEGLSLEDRARFLGHSNLNTTRIYSEGEGEQIKNVVRKW
jgi:site-specific recombinase XerD